MYYYYYLKKKLCHISDGGMEKDLRRAEEYLVSHLEARRTPKSDWGSSHTPAVLIALQITNHHWCLDNVDNRRSVDRLEIGILASLARYGHITHVS